MCQITIGVNTAMFDGVDMDIAFATIRQAGFRYVELAYNQGYVGDLHTDLFSEENADYVRRLLQRHQLATQTLGCTMNLAADQAVQQFTQRIHFASRIGARYLTTCIGRRSDYSRILSNLQQLVPVAEAHHCVICLENGGDPDYDLFSLADDGFALLQAIGSPATVAFNVDAGNIVSLCPEKNAIQEALTMLPGAQHCHIKDVIRCAEGYFFPAIGHGSLDYRPLLNAMAARHIPCSLEIPLRMHRKPDSYPQRASEAIAAETSLQVLRQSRVTLEKWLGYVL